MGTCCWMITRSNGVKNGEDYKSQKDNIKKGQQKKDNIKKGQQKSVSTKKIGDEDVDLDDGLFSFYKGMRKCEQLVREYVMRDSENVLQTQNQDRKQRQQDSLVVNKDVYSVQQVRIRQYLGLLDRFIGSGFFQMMKKLLQEIVITNNKNIQSVVQFINVQQLYLKNSSKQQRKLLHRLVRDLVNILKAIIETRTQNQQHYKSISIALQKIRHQILLTKDNQTILNNTINTISNINNINSIKSNSKTETLFMIKMKLNFIHPTNSTIFKKINNNSKPISKLFIKVITLPSPTQQMSQSTIATCPLINPQENNQQSNQYQSFPNTFSLQFVATPNTIIRFQTYPQLWLCSLSVDQFLNKLFLIKQTFTFTKSQQQQINSQNNKQNNIKNHNLNNQNSLNQNLLSKYPYSLNNPQLSLTMQPIPFNFPQYFYKLKLYTKSVTKTLQAITTNSPLPLDLRSSLASNTSYTQSFAFSQSETHKSDGCFGC